jgi:hypothetical protein
MNAIRILCLGACLVLLQGCFNEPDHPGKDSDQSKPSLQMQKPDTADEAPAGGEGNK